MAWPQNWRVAVHDSIDSTMDEARRMAAAGERECFAILALEQTKGRGRRERHWVSPRGNLMATLFFSPHVDAARAATLSFAAGLAVADMIDAAARKKVASLKWPNDVLIDGAKVAGLLVESASDAGNLVDWVAIGVGVNLLHAPEGTPYPASSLAANGIEMSPAQAIAALVPAFDRWLRVWESDGFGPIRQAWLARTALIGRDVTVNLSNESWTGTAIDLDVSGALLVRDAQGLTRAVTAGDVFPLG